MNIQDIEESIKLLEEFTLDICEKYDIHIDDELLEVRDYVTETEFETEFDKTIFTKNKGIILYLMHFKICNDVFPIIHLNTTNRTIKFEMSGQDDSLYIRMFDDGNCLDNLKSVLPHFNMIICKLIDYKQSISQFSNNGFLQSLKREFIMNDLI
tara:strand:- start:10366 stop:10827 length:462 start_codon:yes stop_codon:yes gene_type:complete